MTVFNLNSKTRLSLAAAGVLLASAYLASCGGGGGGGSSNTVADAAVPITTANELPAFDLKGFVYCGKQNDTLELKVRTHVAFGIEKNNRYVYLYNQTGKLKLVAETFGNDPVPSEYKFGYCKTVAADNNDALVFADAMARIKAHMDGTAALTTAELQNINDRITQTMYTLADNEANIKLAFTLLESYEKLRGGAFFINAKTKNGFPNASNTADDFGLDRAVLAIQQSILDIAFTPAMLATYKTALKGKKFNSSDWFPGPVKIPADPAKVYNAKINATMAQDVDLRTAFSQSFARRPTGYYLAAGDVATVTVPDALVNQKFVIQVGANVHDKYIKSTIERPFRVTTKFPIVKNVTEIANPYGGGIYIDVPYMAGAGNVTISIQNAVPAPYFSSTALNNTTLAQWQDIQRKHPAPWADFESDKTMMTLPTRWIYNYDNPVTLMADWDKRMDVVSDLVGRSRVRNNVVLYLIVDTSLLHDAFGIGYPTGNNDYKPGNASDGNNKNWYLRPDKDFSAVEFHELGHAQLFSDFPGEGEASINLLTVAVSNKLYGVSIDEGLGKSMSDKNYLGRPLAAVNWMVTPNFQAGKAMDTSGSTLNEVRYQQRGYAKYAEIAALFGWSKLEAFYAEENRVFKTGSVPEGSTLAAVDSRILRMSIAAGVDLTPLIHFWGVQPVDAAKLKAAIAAKGLPQSRAIYDRLVVYKGMIPADNAAFQAHAAAFLNKPAATISLGTQSPDYGEGWYATWLNKYSATQAQAAKDAMDAILARYFPAGQPL